MDDPSRGHRLDIFITTAKWMLGLIGAIAIVSFILIVGSVSDARKQTLEAIQDLRKQVDLLKDDSHWSKQDRAELHETQGAIREALKRLEVQK